MFGILFSSKKVILLLCLNSVDIKFDINSSSLCYVQDTVVLQEINSPSMSKPYNMESDINSQDPECLGYCCFPLNLFAI